MVDIDISVVVTEYQAEVLVNQQTGERFVAPFPKGVNKAVQYGSAVKAHAGALVATNIATKCYLDIINRVCSSPLS